MKGKAIHASNMLCKKPDTLTKKMLCFYMLYACLHVNEYLLFFFITRKISRLATDAEGDYTKFS